MLFRSQLGARVALLGGGSLSRWRATAARIGGPLGGGPPSLGLKDP